MTFTTYFSPGVSLQGGSGGSSSGGTPGGSSGQLQYNDGGAFGGMAGTTWDNTTRALTITGYSLTGSASASFIDLSGTWNTSGTPTLIKANVTDTASNGGSMLMDLQRGGASQFNVRKDGAVYATNGIIAMGASGGGPLFMSTTAGSPGYNMASGLGVGWTNSAASAIGAPDTILTRRAAANLRLGAADAAASATVTITIATPGVVTWSGHGLSTGTPVIFTTTGALPTGITAGTTYYAIVVDTNTIRIATSLANALAGTAVNTSGSQSGTQTGSRGAIAQTSSVQSVVAGTTNFPGADKIITGSQGTGTGAGGSIVFQVAPAGSTSNSVQNALATALTINADRSITVAANASSLAQIAMADRGTVLSIYTNAFGEQPILVSAPGGVSVNNNTGSYSLGVTTDVRLFRDDANKLALRNGTNAQEFRVYETTTGTIYKAILGNRQLMKIAGAAFDNGAGANAGTLANSPVTGNPTKWIPIDDNGTTRYIPAW